MQKSQKDLDLKPQPDSLLGFAAMNVKVVSTLLIAVVLPAFLGCGKTKEAALAECKMKAAEVVKPTVPSLPAMNLILDPALLDFLQNCMIAGGYTKASLPACSEFGFQHVECWE